MYVKNKLLWKHLHIVGLFSLALCAISLNALLSEYDGRSTVTIIRNLSVYHSYFVTRLFQNIQCRHVTFFWIMQ